MVDGEERLSLLPCGIFVAERRSVLRPGRQAAVGAFFGEEDHVEVGEHRGEASHRGELRFLGVAFAFRGACLVALLAVHGWHRDDTGPGDDLEVPQRLFVVGDETLGAEATGLHPQLVNDPLVGAASAGVVTCDLVSRHRRKGSTDGPDRAEIVERILSILDAACLELGGLVDSEHKRSIDDWAAWVESELPFTVEEARRLRALFLAYALFPAETIERLPRPWTALWTIPAGRIGRGMPRHATAAKRVSASELLATRLMQTDPGDVSMDVVAALVAWLHERDSGGSGEAPESA